MSTSTVQDRKAPGAGTKVNPGRNDPAVRETAGNVASESLAAESYREDGGFADNRGAEPENLSSRSRSTSGAEELSAAANSNTRGAAHDATLSNAGRYDEAAGRGADNMGSSYAGTAPSYISSQYHKDPNGPHGKNLTEGDWDESQGKDGLRRALASEPGSKNDPSRLAEQDFKLKQSTGGRDTGPKQHALDKQTPFDSLDSDTPA